MANPYELPALTAGDKQQAFFQALIAAGGALGAGSATSFQPGGMARANPAGAFIKTLNDRQQAARLRQLQGLQRAQAVAKMQRDEEAERRANIQEGYASEDRRFAAEQRWREETAFDQQQRALEKQRLDQGRLESYFQMGGKNMAGQPAAAPWQLQMLQAKEAAKRGGKPPATGMIPGRDGQWIMDPRYAKFQIQKSLMTNPNYAGGMPDMDGQTSAPPQAAPTTAPRSIKTTQEPLKDLSPAARSRVATDLVSKAQARIKETSALAESAKLVKMDLERFKFLNKDVDSGGIYKLPGAPTVGGVFSENVEEMNSISDKLTPAMRQGLPGAASERDTAMFRSATVSTNKSRAANDNIADAAIMLQQNIIDRAEFFQEFQQGNPGKGLVGAEAKWTEYINEHPIFDRDRAVGSYAINPDRMTFREYYGLVPQRPKAPPAPAGAIPVLPPGFVTFSGN